MKRISSLTFSAVTLLVIALLIALPSITTSARSVALPVEEDEPDKEAMHARMKELQTSIENLWKQHNQSQEVRAQIDAAQQEFDSISSQLGGDRPVAEAPQEEAQQSLQLQLSPQAAALAPIGCPTTASTFSASPAARIPTSGTSGSRTFTITVSGIGTSVWDVDAITNLTHTACADLDITLTSPAGTVVTLTTDNAGSLNDVFNGTLWDDQANPGGQVPYSSNNGVASDHAYSNNTLASPLVPEEAMGAFIGEDPNGVWTLKITDDSFGDIGNLASWSLNITTLGASTFTTQTVFSSTDANLPAILANGCIGEVGGPVTSTVNVAGMGNHIGRVLLRTEIAHLSPDDLDITLTSPSGKVVTITTDNGPLPLLANDAFDGTNWLDRANLGGQVPYPTCLIIFPCNQGLATDRIYSGNGTAANLVPEEAMAAFNGEDPNGVWTLKVVDDSCNLSIGSLKAWSLDITTATCCSITCPADITQGNSPGQCGANVSFSPTDNGMCSTVSCLPASGSFFPVGTTTVTCSTAAGPGCSFTITVNDTEAPQISCAPIVATGLITSGSCATVTYPNPSATDNCGTATVVCTPPSGSCFPLGVTTVNCVATDPAGNSSSTAVSCPSGGTGVAVQVFDSRLQDDTRPARVVVFNSVTGDYQYCCDGMTLTGKATKITKKGMEIQLEDNRPDRRVLIKLSKATFRGNASANMFLPPNFQCQIEDRDTRNDTNICSASPPPLPASSKLRR